jgi:hypothetical protein
MSDSDNLIYGPLNRMRLLIAAAASFQTLVGHPADAAAAAGHVFCPMIDDSAGAVAARPFALVDFGDTHEMIRSSSDTFLDSGDVLVQFDVAFPSDETLSLDDPTATERADAGHKWFSKLLGDILAEMIVLSNGPLGHLRIMFVRQRFAAMRSHPEDAKTLGDFYIAVYSIGWR